MNYKATTIPFWSLIDKKLELPDTVSFFGAMPIPKNAYELKQRASIEVNDNGRITYSNYFFGKRITTIIEAEKMVKKLNERKKTNEKQL